MAKKKDIPLGDYQCMQCKRVQQYPMEHDFTYGHCYGCNNIAGFILISKGELHGRSKLTRTRKRR